MGCPNCEGFLLREPASVRCVACGCRWEVPGASDDARLAQRLLDWVMRPRSIECWPEYQDLVTPPSHPGRGWVHLPDPTREKRRRAVSPRAPSSSRGLLRAPWSRARPARRGVPSRRRSSPRTCLGRNALPSAPRRSVFDASVHGAEHGLYAIACCDCTCTAFSRTALTPVVWTGI